MDLSERAARAFLRHQGFADIVHEPDGNIPPDFVVDKRVAVEVRRLNQHHLTATGHEGLEQAAFLLHAVVRGAIQSFGPPISGRSWFVGYTFGRPLPHAKELDAALKRGLKSFLLNPSEELVTLPIADRCEIDLFPASQPHRTVFVLGGSLDHDSGGFVVSELVRNIDICVAEKSAKIERVREKYEEWWLILVDHIGYALESAERAEVRKLAGDVAPWKRVILVNPLKPRQAFEL